MKKLNSGKTRGAKVVTSAFRAKLSIAVTMMMFLLLFVLTTSAQVVSQERTVTPFSVLSINGEVKVELIQGSLQSVVVEAEAEQQELITVSPWGKGDVLMINGKSGNKGVVRVTTPALTGVKVSGTSELTGNMPFIIEKIKIEALGASKVKLNLEGSTIETDAQGASVMTLSGRCDKLNLKAGGASHCRFDSLVITSAVVNLSGASSARLNVAEKVEGQVTGASAVTFLKEPAINELKVSSVASFIEQLDSELPQDMKTGDLVSELKKSKSKKATKFNGHFKGVELGINTYLNSNNEFKLPEGAEYMALKMPNSLTVNLNLLEANLPIIKQNFGLVTGMGIEFNNYKFEESNYIKKVDGQLAAIPSEVEFKKSKLSCSYLKVPFMLEYQTNSGSKKSSFHIGGGANFGLRLRSHTKYNLEDGGRTIKEKEWDRFYLNPFRVAGIVKFGWGPLNFFAEYNLLPLFETGKGPELYPVSFGIALVNWN